MVKHRPAKDVPGDHVPENGAHVIICVATFLSIHVAVLVELTFTSHLLSSLLSHQAKAPSQASSARKEVFRFLVAISLISNLELGNDKEECNRRSKSSC
jgi:hypothetical protein